MYIPLILLALLLQVQMILDLILYLKKKKCLPKKYYFLEKSFNLTKIQKKVVDALELGESVDFIWINKYEDLPSEAFIITNEFFDCIPTDIIKHKNNLFHKAYVMMNLKYYGKNMTYSQRYKLNTYRYPVKY